VEVDAAAVQAGELADTQAGAEQGDDVVPPKQRETGQQLAGFLGGEGAALAGPQDQVRVGATLGTGTLRTGLVSIAPSSRANWKIRRVNERHWPRVAGPTLAARSRCQRRTSAGPMRSMGRSPNQGRTCSRSRLSAMARVLGLRSRSVAYSSHHSSAHRLNGSRPRRRPCQAPRRSSGASRRPGRGPHRRSQRSWRLGSRRPAARRPDSGSSVCAKSPSPFSASAPRAGATGDRWAAGEAVAAHERAAGRRSWQDLTPETAGNGCGRSRWRT
jgi:hypothetical protein